MTFKWITWKGKKYFLSGGKLFSSNECHAAEKRYFRWWRDTHPEGRPRQHKRRR